MILVAVAVAAVKVIAKEESVALVLVPMRVIVRVIVRSLVRSLAILPWMMVETKKEQRAEVESLILNEGEKSLLLEKNATGKGNQ